MKLLILGGTEFLGRHLVEAASAQGHAITLFNRNKTNPKLFPDIDLIQGNRINEIEKIEEDHYDAIIDTNGYHPGNMDYVTSHLKNKTDLFVFISTINVYDFVTTPVERLTEDSALVDLDVDYSDESDETYGARKYLCEEVVHANLADKALIIRPGLLVGPYDPTYRFPYWADRIAEGGKVLCPGDPKAPLQFIDARDLSQWILLALERGLKGRYNASSPLGELSLGTFLQTVKEEINPSCELVWKDEAYLKEKGVSCWTSLPLWIYNELSGFLKLDSSKAIKNGLKFRSIKESICDTHEWSAPLYKDRFLSKVLSREKEQSLL